ncbi:MAG TPA: transglutaminase domain-containing protein [Treponemataceae bacterium]|nr:transglutaminase domain-containing protein [Treponemataceae bacterium]
MSFKIKAKYFFRKHTLFRAGVYALVFFLAVGVSVFLANWGAPAPLVVDMNPAVGEPGDILTIRGKYFADKDTSSYVEIGGNRITSSLYLSWQDDTIKIVLPPNIEDGLVYVCTKNGCSEPRMFANKQTIPVPAPQNPQVTNPLVYSLSDTQCSVGDIITLNGSNFGELRGESEVLFPTSEMTEKRQPIMIACSVSDKDYQYWSATEVQVRVPDGAVSGVISVKTNKGTSAGYPLEIVSRAGEKKFNNKLTYVLSINADVSDAVFEKNALITLFIPKPVADSRQRDITISVSEPEPTMKDFMNTVVHQLELNSKNEKKTVLESYVLSVWGVQTTINEWNVSNYSKLTITLYSEYLKSDAVTPSDNKAIQNVAASIIKNEKNPWIKARLLYDYILNNFTVLAHTRASDADVLDLLKTKEGDAYDYAVVYTSLLRAAEIPAVTKAGILVDSTLKTRNHWWCEFYIEDIGWVPADPAMGDGYVFGTFVSTESSANDHFGTIDSRHIAFSHGLNSIKPAYSKSKKIHREKTWALMSIWEESSVDTFEYSSFWSDVMVTGVY